MFKYTKKNCNVGQQLHVVQCQDSSSDTNRKHRRFDSVPVVGEGAGLAYTQRRVNARLLVFNLVSKVRVRFRLITYLLTVKEKRSEKMALPFKTDLELIILQRLLPLFQQLLSFLLAEVLLLHNLVIIKMFVFGSSVIVLHQ